jgi:glucose-6-phosphate isomerase, archaeal
MKRRFQLYKKDIFIERDQVIFDNEKLIGVTVRTRTASDLRDVWMVETITGKEIVYSTYLGIIKEKDKEIFRKADIEHGIVIMLPGLYGKEYPKLYGHYHEHEQMDSRPSPEIHSVLSGRGLFLLQKSTNPYNVCTDAILIEAQEGDTFLIPPYYGHVAINIGDEVLIFNGFYNVKMRANYMPFKKNRGALYYVIKNDNSIPEMIPNRRYPHIPPLRFSKAKDLPTPKEVLNFTSCYEGIINMPSQFGFLSNPEKFQNEWLY